MADNQKIYHLENRESSRFKAVNVIDFSKHEIYKDILQLRDRDWVHVFMSDHSLCFDGMTFNLRTYTQAEFNTPKKYFGQVTEKDLITTMFDDDDSEEEDENIDENDWHVQSQQNMNSTLNMISICQKEQKEFCFVVEPAPSSRKLTIVGQQQIL